MKFLESMNKLTDLPYKSPGIVTSDIFTSEQIADICEKFFPILEKYDKNLWNRSDICALPLPVATILSLGWYHPDEFRKVYLDAIKQYKELMWENFGEYYKIVFDAVEQYLGATVEIRDDLHYPGFWYRKSCLNKDIQWHNDTFGTGGEILPFNKNSDNIHAFTIPLKLPYQPCPGLGYNCDVDLFQEPEDFIASLDEHKQSRILDYTVGNMYSWPGKLSHRVASLEASIESPRLSMHFFGYVENNKIIIFW